MKRMNAVRLEFENCWDAQVMFFGCPLAILSAPVLYNFLANSTFVYSLLSEFYDCQGLCPRGYSCSWALGRLTRFLVGSFGTNVCTVTKTAPNFTTFEITDGAWNGA